ncbi:MAG: hypothetical protein A3J48_03265 [Candidatus Doudnabacteria bacterium RIFCSPHIGHO2_02_FULL_46_11]|uniref:Serine aminopeptidase S33 domain-containing protein n=1 Tax=Candidatus Doudnabacteria bacterium RIFCSPHIGHO2_02_FULL_46_11 TaxID=1817832 RepID=A0A1F5P7W6_9BACT|nr:MAG: hypothetical protein A3J48_03265 [Candidatus Doudnabacteria bacterium RIFCSPHIGHO2_02_FULL_46_11]
MEKLFIKNRKGQKIAVIVEKPENPKGLAFVMHGLGSWKERPITNSQAAPFLSNGYTVVRFDTTNSYGESDGSLDKATTTNYLEDLEDVISWGQSQPWYQEPFILSGHSLGGICTGIYAAKHPEKIKGWNPVGSVISGELRLQQDKNQEVKTLGYKDISYWDSNGHEKVTRLPLSHFEDALKYNLLDVVDKLRMPVLIVIGELDSALPHQYLLYEKLSGPKELEIIANAPHTFEKKDHLDKLQQLLDRWIKKTLNN